VDGSEDGWAYFGGIDLSVNRDATAIVVVGKKHGMVKLVRVLAWKPVTGSKINYDLVWNSILELQAKFAPSWYIDPYQAEWLNQQLQRLGVFAETVKFTGQSAMEMASSLIEIFSARHIEIYNDAMLISDLRRLKIRETPAGYALQAPRTGQGHCDRATALALAVLGARRAGAVDWMELIKPSALVREKKPDQRTGLSYRKPRLSSRLSSMDVRSRRRW